MDTHPERVGLAIVRAVVEPGANVAAVIQILELSDLMGDARVLGITASPDEAGRILGAWLRRLIGDDLVGPMDPPRRDAGVTPE